MKTQFWKKYFTEYDALNLLIPYRDLLEAFLQGVSQVKGPHSRLLDLGSGTGNVCEHIKGKFSELYAIDSSEEGMLLHRKKNKDVNFFHQDITEKLPFENEFFDAVVSNNVLYTIAKEKRLEIIKESFRILKPGGLIILGNLTPDFRPGRIYWYHVKQSLKRKGFLKTAKELVLLLKPTVMILYYNYLIKKEGSSQKNYSFFKAGEQKDLIGEVGFVEIKEKYGEFYAGGATFLTAKKPK